MTAEQQLAWLAREHAAVWFGRQGVKVKVPDFVGGIKGKSLEEAIETIVSIRAHNQEVAARAAAMERYYVQRLGKLYLVRELQVPSDMPSSQDLLIRRFTTSADAQYYAAAMNELQRQLDAKSGQQWSTHAVTPSQARAAHE